MNFLTRIGIKHNFHKQQVDLAKEIFVSDKTSLNKLKVMLSGQNLGCDTIRFCNHIVKNYSFSQVLECAMKRAMWLFYIPELSDIEAEAL